MKVIKTVLSVKQKCFVSPKDIAICYDLRMFRSRGPSPSDLRGIQRVEPVA